MQKAHTFTRTLIFIFSIIIGYFLWTYLRPRFVTPEEVTSTTQTNPTAEPTQTASSSEQVSAATPETVSAPAAQPKEEDLSSKKPQKTSQKSSPAPLADKKATPAQLITKNEAKTSNGTKTITGAVSSATTHTITVVNGIEKKMLGYRKFGTHYPTTFKLSIGDKILEEGSSISTPIQDNTFVVRYDFEFMNGYRNGAEEVTFTLKPGVEKLTLVFDWKRENRLYAETDKVISIVEKNVPYQA